MTAGDWLIVDTTIAYTDIGQTYPQFAFTPTGGSAAYPSLQGVYQQTVTNSSSFCALYVVPADGSITLIKFNNSSYVVGTGMVALAQNTPVTFTNLKVARIPAANRSALGPAVVSAATATMTVPTGTPTDLRWSPTVSATEATAGQLLVGAFARGAVTADNKTHYINSSWGWAAVQSSTAAQTVGICKKIATTATTNWMQVGIQGQSPAAADTLAITDVEIRLISPL